MVDIVGRVLAGTSCQWWSHCLPTTAAFILRAVLLWIPQHFTADQLLEPALFRSCHALDQLSFDYVVWIVVKEAWGVNHVLQLQTWVWMSWRHNQTWSSVTFHYWSWSELWPWWTTLLGPEAKAAAISQSRQLWCCGLLLMLLTKLPPVDWVPTFVLSFGWPIDEVSIDL